MNVTGKHVHVPVLMIDETFDPATPYEGSLYVRKIFPTASLDRGQERDDARRLAVRGRVHRRRDRAYLAHGTVPPRRSGNQSDKVCPPVPAPVPPSAATSSAQPQVSGTCGRGPSPC